MADEKAPKLDGGKPPMHLVHPVFKRQLAEVLAFGAKKYEPWSWMRGKEWSRDFAATQRHLDDWWLRKVDPETGKSHLWHAGCDLMFLAVSEELGLGTDDRPAIPSPVLPMPLYLDHIAHHEWARSCGAIIKGLYGCTRPDGHRALHEFFDGARSVRE